MKIIIDIDSTLADVDHAKLKEIGPIVILAELISALFVLESNTKIPSRARKIAAMRHALNKSKITIEDP